MVTWSKEHVITLYWSRRASWWGVGGWGGLQPFHDSSLFSTLFQTIPHLLPESRAPPKISQAEKHLPVKHFFLCIVAITLSYLTLNLVQGTKTPYFI